MTEETQKRFGNILDWFRKNSKDAESELHFDSPFHLLMAVILSAQCTDKRVNVHTPALFLKYPEPEDLAQAPVSEVLSMIQSISFPNNKAGYLVDMARMLVEEYGGEVPDDVDELMKLPGVGKKTANVVASIVYNKPVIAVDTHVFRVSHRLGLSDGKSPLAVEKDLEAGIPENERPKAHHWLILHGRYVCTARKPHCQECGLKDFCRYFSDNGK